MALELKDYLIIASTILGPILAVQAQKAVEGIRDRRNRKMWVFHSLMATRAARLAPDHVQALNMIDLAFYGRRIMGIARRSGKEQSVLDAWHEYHDHLNTKFDDSTFQIWLTQGDELFTNLLFSIATDLGLRFDRVQLKKGAYSPVAHGEMEQDQNALRKLALKVLTGDASIKMDVMSIAFNEAALKSQIDLQQRLASTIDESGSMKVKLQKDEPAS